MSNVRYERIYLPLHPSAAQVASELNAFFVANPQVNLIEATLTKGGAQPQTSTLNITYEAPGGQGLAALAFVGGPTASADNQAATYFAGNPLARAVATLDVTPSTVTRLSQDALVVIVSLVPSTPCGSHVGRTLLLSPTADILSMATGTASVLGQAGPVGGLTVTVRNNFIFTWPAGVPGLAAQHEPSCEWQGFPSCCPP